MTRIGVEYLVYLHPGRVKCLLYTEYMSMFITMHILVRFHCVWANNHICDMSMPCEWMCVQNVKYESLNILYSLVIFAFKNLSDSLFLGKRFLAENK